MDVTCDDFCGQAFWPGTGSCRPTTSFDAIFLEHGTLALVQLAKSAWLAVWLLNMPRRTVTRLVGSTTALARLGLNRTGSSQALAGANSLAVLPVYATFLWFEAAQCFAWGVLFAWQSLADSGVLGGNGHATVISLEVARYVTTFTWALCGEGVASFLCLGSAGVESLRLALKLGALWAALLVTASAVAFFGWASCSAPPEAPAAAQLLWVGAWLPYWLRFVLMIPLYAITAVVLVARGRGVAWQRGALQLALFNLAMASLFLVPRLVFGVFTPAWLATDLVATPLAWVAYVPFLLWVLQRDSRFWVSSGFTACLLGNAGGSEAELHRVPLLAQRASTGKVAPPRFLIIEPRQLVWGNQIGSGASSVVSEASLFGQPVAIKQMVVSHLTLEFARLFLTEAECLAACRHPNIVKFVGGCVAPPLVCLVMERCESNVHALLHPRGTASTAPPLPPERVCALLHGVIAGMAFLHGTMGVTHGDLKPLNLLLTRRGEVKVCDFGSSRLLQFPIADLAETGTLPYLAPEVLSGGGGSGGDVEAAQAFDVYSFGIICWECCTRLYPWHALLRAGKAAELKRRVATLGERPDAADCPRRLRMLFEACWRQTPSQRPSFAALEALDVRRLAADDDLAPELDADVQRAVDGYLEPKPPSPKGEAQAAMALEVLVSRTADERWSSEGISPGGLGAAAREISSRRSASHR